MIGWSVKFSFTLLVEVNGGQHIRLDVLASFVNVRKRKGKTCAAHFTGRAEQLPFYIFLD